MSKLRILLADDHAIVREAMKMLINAQPDMEVVAEAADGETAIERAQQVALDVVVMDVAMPRLNGLRAIEVLKRSCPQVKVLTLTRHSADGYVRQVLHSGASGYVLKQSRADDFLRGVRVVGRGGTFLDPAISARARRGSVSTRGGLREPVALSAREESVLRLVARGCSNKETADRLGVSVKTVETHKIHGMQKLGMSSRADLVRFAYLEGWLDAS
jgi:DNA-binding NarL/FixJ family response regulator